MKKDTKIIIKGARVNNLQNISVEIPAGKLTCITGLSGSGKSSLAFDTLFAEGQRRYVESLSSYARQFLGRMMKPDVDFIEGIAPAIAIEQKTSTKNSRSTVGTITEVYDYLKLLFARIGQTYSPISNKEVRKHYTKDVLSFLQELNEGMRIYILSPFNIKEDHNMLDALGLYLQQGYSRVFFDEKTISIDSLIEDLSKRTKKEKDFKNKFILVDRAITTNNFEDIKQRLSSSIETAFAEGFGKCTIFIENINHYEYFSNIFEKDGINFEEPSINFFSFNNPHGACSKCNGFGNILGIDPELVIPNHSLSIYGGAIAPWKGEKMSEWLNCFLKVAHKFNFPIHIPYNELSNEQKDLLWKGNKYFHGISDFFQMLEENLYKIQYRVMLARYKGRAVCPSCKGTRLREDAGYVKIQGKSIVDLVLLSVRELRIWFKNIELTEKENKICHHILLEINSRLEFLTNTGLEYLTLNRLSNTLSGGETQRINLSRALGSSLIGSMYILDEPSIGLHPVDTEKLIKVLKNLRDLGNTVIIVEHDEDIIRVSDHIIDIGPDAGKQGGKIVFEGTFKDLIQNGKSHTAAYFKGEEKIDTYDHFSNPKYFIELKNVSQNNLKNINVKFPINAISFVTGVSGSGKSSLVRQVLYPLLQRNFGQNADYSKGELSGDFKLLTGVEMVDQNPIGRSSRSNPATYTKVYDEIRELFSTLPLSTQRGYRAGFFSFNVEGGRCETCQGDGYTIVEMQFMADVHLLCEECGGKRFKAETLDVKFEDKTIFDILNLTVNEAINVFKNQQKEKHKNLCGKIIEKLLVLQDVGLGYLQLGQSASSLSGGEAQRIKLASFLMKANPNEAIIFIFDEPTTGLHYHDISYFYKSISKLIKAGHTIVIVEHNMELIRCADYIIDLGPKGGDLGGKVIYQGKLDGILDIKESVTAKYLSKKTI